VVLFVSLIILVVIGGLTMSLVGMARMEMRMAANEEARINGLQLSQALSDMIISDPDMTPVIGTAGFKLCQGNLANCDQAMPALPDNVVADAVRDGHLTASATRSDPEFRPPPRGLGFSSSKFVGTSFNLETTYDRTEDGQGYAGVEEGLFVLIPL